MGKFRNRPVEIEAWQLPFADCDMPHMLADHPDVIFKRDRGMIVEAIIFTLEGAVIAELGDWIIRNNKGELHRCKPNIFEATYDASSTFPAQGQD